MLNSQVLAELSAVFAAYEADDTQRCLVLTGSEKGFAAGADIKEMVNLAFETGLSQSLIIEHHLFQILAFSEDRKEGMAAFSISDKVLGLNVEPLLTEFI